LKEDQLLTKDELPRAARKARLQSGLSQQQAAEQLGVNQANISKAENDASGSYVKLQSRMMRELADWTIEGPRWRVIKS
jgi:transcriptional regulator with XRE-family HTH domain